MDEILNTDPPLILIVEDDDDTLNYMAKILTENGYDLAIARDENRALNYLSTGHIDQIDLILLDVSLSKNVDNRGFEVCKQFKNSEKAKHIPVIFLSVHDEEETVLQGFAVGGVDYVIKKKDKKHMAEMLARVKTHIALRRSYFTEMENTKLKELNDTKNTFIGMISHDFRSLFQSVKGNSDFLEKYYNNLEEKIKLERIKKINKSCVKIYALFENFLELAKILLIEMKPPKNQFDLKFIIESNISLHKEDAVNKNITLTNSILSQCLAYANQSMVDFVVRNLIHNAIKFTETGGNIDIRTTDGNEYIEISISDTGKGIPGDRINKLFSNSHSCSTLSTDGEKGAGFGLIFSKKFVNDNGGEIRVESEVGKGSTFTIILPKSLDATVAHSSSMKKNK